MNKPQNRDAGVIKEEMMALMKRAIDHPRWEWLDGCVNELAEPYMGRHIFYLGTYPDFSQAASLGCLRHLAAKAHGGFDVTVYEVKGHDTPTGKWAVLDREGRTIKWGIFDLPQSEDFTAWGLVEALEAAK